MSSVNQPTADDERMIDLTASCVRFCMMDGPTRNDPTHPEYCQAMIGGVHASGPGGARVWVDAIRPYLMGSQTKAAVAKHDRRQQAEQIQIAFEGRALKFVREANGFRTVSIQCSTGDARTIAHLLTHAANVSDCLLDPSDSLTERRRAERGGR